MSKNKETNMKQQKTNNYFYLYKRMFHYIKPYLPRFIIAMLITIPIGALDAGIAFSLRPYMDNVLIEKSVKASWYIPIIIVGFTVFQGALNYVSTYTNGWLCSRITNDIKFDLYGKLLRYESSFFDKGSSGRVITRFSGDVDNVTTGLLNNVRTLLTRIFSSIALTAVLLFNSWQLAIIAVTVLSSTLIPLSQIRKRIKHVSEGMVKTGGVLLTNYNETFSGNKLIASYNLQGYQENIFKKSLKEYFNLNMKITKLNGWLTPFMHIVASIGIALVVWYGSHLILTKQITSGAFISFITALIMLYTPIKGIGNIAVATQNSFLALERILELLDRKPLIQNSPSPIILDTVKNDISFENVSFEYEKDKKALININLKVRLGETTALVGNSGGGKSTLVNLIPRFYELTEGCIKIDGIDIRNIDLTSLREIIGVVFQDNFLFDGTIKENILLGKPEATEEELKEAVNGAYLDDFVYTLEKGLDTQIGERGVMLSGGQKQRVAIARALLKNAPIVILDEATSALDNKSEAMVQKAIDRLMKDRTVFVIAHRLSTVQHADRIVVLDEGRIVETGTHEGLLNKENGLYKNLYNSQFKPNDEIPAGVY
jgi:ATP-binding cassette, subfamily B, bacterial MsbA